jgi:PelA/Pel-15E family pectate lyase
MRLSVCPVLLLALAGGLPGRAAIVGRIPPAPSLTAARVTGLPLADQAPWLDYLARSERQRRADHAAVAAELRASGRPALVVPAAGPGGMPLDRPEAWYASAEALRTADAIVSYQLPNGGWGKNLPMHDHVRQPGEGYIADNVSRFLAPGDYDTPRDPAWNYFGTLDNDATTTQLRFLAQVINAAGPDRTQDYRAAFLRGVDYLCAAQYPNGGWPQVWPLEGGYHDAITFNDDAVTQAIEVLQGVADGSGIYAFTTSEVQRRARPHAEKGYACIVATQIRAHGRLTVWCQQHDALTLEPASGRNYEPPAQCSEESAHIVSFLMTDPSPRPEIIAAIHAAAAWFKRTALYGERWNRPGGKSAPAAAGPPGLVAAPGAGPIWARYYEIGTDRPVFGDRDHTLHDRVDELSLERQRGYRWFTDGPKRMLAQYASWSIAYPAP